MAISPKIYLILGPKNSGRRTVFLECLDVLDENTSVLYFRHESDLNPKSDLIDAKIAKQDSIEIVDWKVENTKIKHNTIQANPDYIFFLAPADVDLADLIEGLKGWLNKNECSLTRITLLSTAVWLKQMHLICNGLRLACTSQTWSY